MSELSIEGRGGIRLSATRGGSDEGPARIVMLHGLTATRHYTVMGSRHLDRRGIANVSYDARGHGKSQRAAGPSEYTYGALASDLGCVLDHVAPADPVVLLGISMGAHTAVRYAIDHPERVRGLVLITPAHFPGAVTDDYTSWDRLADSLRGEHPIDQFVIASDLSNLDPQFRDGVEMAIRQRIGRHEDLGAVADALNGVPRSAPFDVPDDLRAIDAPAIVVGSRDEADPSHPLAVAQRWAELLRNARLEVEEPGKSPLAWQGGRLARFAEELAGDQIA